MNKSSLFNSENYRKLFMNQGLETFLKLPLDFVFIVITFDLVFSPTEQSSLPDSGKYFDIQSFQNIWIVIPYVRNSVSLMGLSQEL